MRSEQPVRRLRRLKSDCSFFEPLDDYPVPNPLSLKGLPGSLWQKQLALLLLLLPSCPYRAPPISFARQRARLFLVHLPRLSFSTFFFYSSNSLVVLSLYIFECVRVERHMNFFLFFSFPQVPPPLKHS